MDPYKILGIDKDATPDDVRRAYRKKVSQYHPNQGGDVWIFQQIQDAYDELTGKKKRKNAAPPKKDQEPQPSGFYAHEFKSETKTSSQFRRSSSATRRKPASRRKRDSRAKFLITLIMVPLGGIAGISTAIILLWVSFGQDPLGLFRADAEPVAQILNETISPAPTNTLPEAPPKGTLNTLSGTSSPMVPPTTTSEALDPPSKKVMQVPATPKANLDKPALDKSDHNDLAKAVKNNWPNPQPMTKSPAVANEFERNSSPPGNQPNESPAIDPPSDFNSIFDGTDLSNWRVVTAPKHQRVPRATWIENRGAGIIEARARGHSELQSVRKFQDFQITLEWRFMPGGKHGANGGGVVVRSDGGWGGWGLDPKGIEIDFRPKSGEDAFAGTGALISYNTVIDVPRNRRNQRNIKRIAKVQMKNNGWNSCKIICQGENLDVYINERHVNEAKGIPVAVGPVYLRCQNCDIQYRDVVIEDLTSQR